MLALADLIAAAAASLVVTSGFADAFWALVLLPGWVVLAKLIGLYDRDHVAIRHLTVDELPALAAWAAAGVAMLALILPQTPAGEVQPSSALLAWVVAGTRRPGAPRRRALGLAAADAARGHRGARRRRPGGDDPAQARALSRTCT